MTPSAFEAARLLLRLSRSEFADMLGISEGAVEAYEGAGASSLSERPEIPAPLALAVADLLIQTGLAEQNRRKF
ncbi:helix-turn-helix domain-containing protein [Arenibaculum pallidiluteum]|uniref:hypothetical protein n=1 Tax=Arenibaculum pallidiluteum TaxID=2812559 RepID=UPI001A97A1A8|nr:hypothetical protein [Arenibaculum pallidiluteum]